MNIILSKTSNFIVNNPKRLIIFWVLLFSLCIVNLIFTPNSFDTGLGEIKNTESHYVENIIKNNFSNQIPKEIIITVKSNKILDQEQIISFQNDLLKITEIKKVFSSFNSPIPNILSEDKKKCVLLMQIEKKNFSQMEKLSVKIRDYIKQINPKYSNLNVNVTGISAFSYDMNQISEEEGQKAEQKVIILIFFILVLAFRSITASSIAVLSGLLASLITISILKFITGFYTLSVFCQNVSSMVGLGLSIDYSLLMITRYRKERESYDKVKALEIVMQTSGKSVIYSGLMVLIGFIALYIPPLVSTKSLATGGLIVVLLSIAIAITLTPSLLFLIDDYLNYPNFIYKMNYKDTKKISLYFAKLIVNNSFISFFVSTGLLLILCIPAFDIKISEPDIIAMPEKMESKIGFIDVVNVSNSNILATIEIIATPKRGYVRDSNNIINLYDLSYKLKKQMGVFDVKSLTTLKDGMTPLEYMFLYSNYNIQEFEFFTDIFISKDKKQTIIQIIPQKDLLGSDINKLVDRLRKIKDENFDLNVGGAGSLGLDIYTILYTNFPKIIISIYTITFILLMISFRSILIPIKAILLNTLSTLASYGVLVLVFQYGYLNGLINLTNSPKAVISIIPILLFCIMFSMSMDYEVFLLSRIQEEYEKTNDNKESIIVGLVETGGVITKAGLIMFIVFFGFLQADIILIKMLGVGLASAILIDTTIIRMILLPAFMKMAGRLNWLMPLKIYF